jgi:hypothetical protein
MGFSPVEVGRMSLWQFHAALIGWQKANGGGEERLPEDEAEALAAWIDEPPIWH